MAAHGGADSLHYLSIEGLLTAVRGSRGDHCLGCFTGSYPLSMEREIAAGISVIPAGGTAIDTEVIL